MKIIVDMNLSPRWVGVLTDAGFDTRHWSAIGIASSNDREILAVALSDDAVVLTNDLDFGTILASTAGKKPSVVQIRANDLSPAAIGNRVCKILARFADELAKGALVTIDATKERVTLLPLIRP